MKIRELFEENFNDIEEPIFTAGDLIKERFPNAVNNKDEDDVFHGNLTFNFEKMTSLEGSPKKVKGNFSCTNNFIKNLKGGPEIVTGFYKCGNNDKLETLEGAPSKVSFFSADYCPKLTNLKFFPEQLENSDNSKDSFFENSFIACNLMSLEGLPKKLNGGLIIRRNKNLTSLSGCSNEINGNFECNECNLHSLIGAPNKIDGDFNCSDNPHLSSLEGMTQEGIYDLEIRNTGITSLKGIARQVEGNIYLENNKNLSSLKNIHKFFEAFSDPLNGGVIYFSHTFVKSNILGLLKIKNLESIDSGNDELDAIINDYLPDPTPDKIIDCQNELIDAGFEEYAEL